MHKEIFCFLGSFIIWLVGLLVSLFTNKKPKKFKEILENKDGIMVLEWLKYILGALFLIFLIYLYGMLL